MASVDEEILKARRAYQNKWRRENKEKVKQYNTRFWLKQAEKLEIEKQDKAADNGENRTEN